MSLFDKVVEFVDTAFKGKQKPHFTRTVYWFERFLPNVTEAHRIAAYAHDSERAFRDESKKIPENYLDIAFLKHHSEKGAEITGKFLAKIGADEISVQKVKHLISQHEVGGDEEQNALMDADSVSFFENNAEMFVKEKAPLEGYKKIKEKFDWMFNRISTNERKEFARKNYEQWSAELDKQKK